MSQYAQVLEGLEWRGIGPYRGGRVAAVAGHPTQENVFYFGSTGGGVWKTDDAGNSWRNISDGYFRRASVGSLAISQSDPNVIYVGMGECSIRSNVSHGDGVYKSTDGGQTWQHMGLENTQNIARVRIHPSNPDIAYAAAFGHVYGPNPERGVYRTLDGGETWELVLQHDEKTGAIDLSMDPSNPRILYASLWQARRTAWSLESGGPGSGLFKSTDGGDTWIEITGNPGLPSGMKGKMGIAVSPAKPSRVFAIIEADEGGLFRSDDSGATWERVYEGNDIRARSWYYMHVIPHPTDPETVYVLNVSFYRSLDGGRTFHDLPVPHGDNHDLYIDPANPQRMMCGSDGGGFVSLNGGRSWSTLYNQPTAEMYHVTTDNRFPYRVYGCQQDNSSISLPSRCDKGPISQGTWLEVGGGEAGYVAVRPDNPDIVFAGNYQGYLTRYNARNHQERVINVWPESHMGAGAEAYKYRFQWTYPIVVSPHDPDVLYVTSNHVHRSMDEGHSFEVISPDLTRDDPSKLGSSGGPITKDNTGAEIYCTIFAFDESPVEQGVLWAGSDDGLVHVSRDGGVSWNNVTPPDVPEWSMISFIAASPHDAATAYVAATAYKQDDYRPYLYKTSDYGQSWTTITDGIAANHFTRVIREDPVQRGLLFAGTEAGVYVSFDDGGQWHKLGGNLPVVPIHDLVVHDDDLVLGTHGRGFWVLDDVTVLRQAASAPVSGTHLFTPRTTVRWKARPVPPWMGIDRDYREETRYAASDGVVTPYFMERTASGEARPVFTNAGENPPSGVLVHYLLDEEVEAGQIQLTILDAQDQVIRSFSGKASDDDDDDALLPTSAGFHRFTWDTRYPQAVKLDGATGWGSTVDGPRVLPGTYKVRLEVAGESQEAHFELVEDPRVEVTQDDLQQQFDLMQEIVAAVTRTNQTIMSIRNVKDQVNTWLERTGQDEAVQAAGEAAKDALEAVEGELIQIKAKTRHDNLAHPAKLNIQIGSLVRIVDGADAAPTTQTVAVFKELSSRLDGLVNEFQDAMNQEVAAFNEAVREAGLPAVEIADPVASQRPR